MQIPEASFTASAGLITFSEVPLGTNNPTYTPGMYGGVAGSPTVTFGGFFDGQHLGAASPPCPTGAALTGCVLGSNNSFTNPIATGPLTLDPTSPVTFTQGDGADPTSPGSPTFNGPVAILFSTDQVGVGLDGGFFDSVGSTAITAFDDNGNVLGQVDNNQTGIEFLGLITNDGSADIRGLLFSLVGDEPAGFEIDNLRFGVQGHVVGQDLPEPATLSVFGVALAGLFAARRKRNALRR